MAGIAHNHHLYRLAEKARARGRPLELAVAIGNHAAVLLASQIYVDLGDDEFAIAGGLLSEPVRLVKCRTVDIEVPAEAEIVLEGVLRPDQLIEEGPVSEFPGFYVSYGPGIAVDIGCVTQRPDAFYQAVLPGFAPEHCLLGAVAIEAVVSHALQRVIPCVRRVLVTDAAWVGYMRSSPWTGRSSAKASAPCCWQWGRSISSSSSSRSRPTSIRRTGIRSSGRWRRASAGMKI
jgi:UbiD family decarboxylase